MEFSDYSVVILPDRVRITESLQTKLNAFLAGGGRLLVTGESGLTATGEDFALELGVHRVANNPNRPDYCRPLFPLPNLGEAAFICYTAGQKVELAPGGIELARREDPYFNRDYFAFCSHQHTPNAETYGGPGMVEHANGIYIAWNIFEDYATNGSLASKELVLNALNRLLPNPTLRTSLPAQGVTTIQRQPAESRYVHHLLYASPIRRGKGIEVIEDIVPLQDVIVELQIQEQINRAYLAPQMTPLVFVQEGNQLKYQLPELECHQMVILEYGTKGI